MKKRYESKIMEAIHEEAQALYEAGAIDKERMTEYDRACFVSEPEKAYPTEEQTSYSGRMPATPAYAHH